MSCPLCVLGCMPLQQVGRGRASPDRLRWLCVTWICQSCYIQGFVKVATWICQCFSLYCICSRWGEGFPSQTGCDGYVRVSAGYLQVMGRELHQTSQSPDPDLGHGQSHTFRMHPLPSADHQGLHVSTIKSQQMTSLRYC